MTSSAACRAAVCSPDISGFGLQSSMIWRTSVGQAASSITGMAEDGLLPWRGCSICKQPQCTMQCTVSGSAAYLGMPGCDPT